MAKEGAESGGGKAVDVPARKSPLVFENALQVRVRANADLADRELDAETDRQKVEGMGAGAIETGVYIQAWVEGKVDPKQIAERFRMRAEEARTKRVEYARTVALRLTAYNGDRRKVREATERDIRLQTRIARHELYWKLTGSVMKIGDTAAEREVDARLDHPFLRGIGRFKKEERDKKCEQFIRDRHIKGLSAPEVSGLAVSHFKSEQEMQVVSNLVADKPALTAFEKTVKQGKTADQALEAAAAASPDGFGKKYREYVATWEQEQFKEILEPPVLDVIPGAAPPGESQIAEAQRAIPAGVTFNIENGNEGEIQFGSLIRDAAIISVNNQPRLVVYDSNADRGFVGPTEPAKAKEVMRSIAIDAYFTEQFQKSSTLDSEKDPAKMRDAKLLDVVHKFLPNGGEGQTDRLTDLERGLVENLVRLLVKPDKEFISVQDKAKFLLRIAEDESSDRFVKAKRRLNEQSENLSLSDL